MPNEKKEPMIGKADRPTPIDYDAPISNFKLRDLVAVVNAQMLEHLKHIPEILKPEHIKPETHKPELVKSEKEIFKVEKEFHKPEKEILKVEKEVAKPEKELLKPEKEFFKPELTKPEFTKPEKETGLGDPVEQIAQRVVQLMKQQGLAK